MIYLRFAIIAYFTLFLLPVRAEALTVNFVSDIHAQRVDSCTNECVPKWKSALKEVLDKTEGMIITAGDNTDKASKVYAQKLRDMTKGEEIYWANGNHDKDIYVGGKKHYVIDRDGWRIILIHYKNCATSDERLWLKGRLKDYKNKKVIAVLHYPIFKSDLKSVKDDCRKVENIFNDYNVDYVFSGHIHDANWTKKYHGVIYKAIRALAYGHKTNYLTISFE